MKRAGYDFHYSDLLPKKPVVMPLDFEQRKRCARCGAEFVTRSRAQKRCSGCQVVVKTAQQKKANQRLKDRRKAAKIR